MISYSESTGTPKRLSHHSAIARLQLEQADRARILAALGKVGGDCLADEGLGLLVGIAHAEVDDLHAARGGLAPGLVEANEGIGAELVE